MLKRGLLVATLLVGCALGVGVREVVFPARAQGATTYAYKLVHTRDLVEAMRQKHPEAGASDAERLELGLNEFGRSGWRYAGCLPSFGQCVTLMFESTMDQTPPPAQRQIVSPPPEHKTP
jgi:hypothetical protein